MISPRAHIIASAIRSVERRGIFLSEQEYDALSDGVRAGLYPQRTFTPRTTVFEIHIKGTTVYAVWSPEHDCIRTFIGSVPRSDRVNAKVTAAKVFKLHAVPA